MFRVFVALVCFLLYHSLLTDVVLGAAFSCDKPDPVHDTIVEPSQDSFISSYDSSTSGSYVAGNQTCLNATYPYPKGLYLTTDVYDDTYMDTETPYKVQFYKEQDDSFLKIQMNTAFKCEGQQTSCRWEVKLNGKYSCSPPAYHDIHNAPNGDHQFRHTFTALCTHWNYGGKTKIPAGVYTVALAHSSLNMFEGATHILPRGTRPHGRLPTTYKGLPTLGDGYQSSLQVEEIPETNTRTVFHQKSVYQATTIGEVIDGARQFTFTKQDDAATTTLKIIAYDNFRCHTRPDVGYGISGMDHCIFEVLIDGSQCSPNVRLRTSHDDHSNIMYGETIVGICNNIGAGDHTLSIRVSGSGRPYLGMLSTTGSIYVEEVPVAAVGSTIQTFTTACTHSDSPSLSFPVCFPFNEPDTNCVLDCRTFTINKPTDSSGIKLQLYDNLSCRNNNNYNGDTCDFEVRINRMSCTDPGPMKFVHTEDGSRDRFRGGIGYVGYCREWDGSTLPAGTYTVRFFQKVLVQNDNDSQCRGCAFNGVRPYVGEGTTGYVEVSFPEPETEQKCYEN